MYKARYWRKINDIEIICLLCPRSCKIRRGESGHCHVRKNVNMQLILDTYGKSSGIAIDPIEKKPLYHFLPGSTVLSFGTIGCNMACSFCQNWNISASKNSNRLTTPASPRDIAEKALLNGAESVAFTYNEPGIFMEYAIDVARYCHSRNIKCIAVTNGYMNMKPAREFYSHLDAANIDLKAFSENFYSRYTDSSLKPVLKLLEYLANHKKVWIEITTLLIPGLNDSDKEIKHLSQWIFDHNGPDTPLHLSAFHPDYQLRQIPSTPLSTLLKAREIALSRGLRYVYTGNISHSQSESTICPHCHNIIIQRQKFSILKFSADHGICAYCQHPVAGYYKP